ncbi:magnesium transporter, partial [Catenaria anguillulae PL171]
MSSPPHERFVGLTLAILSSLMIGSSFVLTKVGLQDASRNLRNGASAGDTHSYLKNAKWWLGMITMGCGEAANFAAYSYAPAILVTPLGALSVLIGAVLASFFLNERLGREGLIGCALCLIGSLIIILHAPEERPIKDMSEMLGYVFQPGFIFYAVVVTFASGWLIYKVAPKHGKENMLVYISICSLVGSISVMAVKAFGIALKLTFEGNNQLGYLSTWVFAVVVAVSAATQMNYFNKALDIFSTNLVTPIYYVLFTTATITASIVMFQGFQDSSVVDIVSVFSGFSTIFIGVFMLNAKGNTDKLARQQSTQALLEKQRTGKLPPQEAHAMATFDEENRPFTLKSDDDEDDP